MTDCSTKDGRRHQGRWHPVQRYPVQRHGITYIGMNQGWQNDGQPHQGWRQQAQRHDGRDSGMAAGYNKDDTTYGNTTDSGQGHDGHGSASGNLHLIKTYREKANRVVKQATLERWWPICRTRGGADHRVLRDARKTKLKALKEDFKKQESTPVTVPGKKTTEDEEDVAQMQ
ncbi:hypothetical protein PHYPSEUDO_001670 [Phytophthora pseudosyringae]|uniref:Uncharacterized protein n=1 Tax=Phytophthora pseudosyringae TaxID=221518 RepID=A0A8T1VWJ3_9STRA|nr:hypothetical protein PHYPSEUDO_001670 [Phytophthora pseudosyringae]